MSRHYYLVAQNDKVCLGLWKKATALTWFLTPRLTWSPTHFVSFNIDKLTADRRCVLTPQDTDAANSLFVGREWLVVQVSQRSRPLMFHTPFYLQDVLTREFLCASTTPNLQPDKASVFVMFAAEYPYTCRRTKECLAVMGTGGGSLPAGCKSCCQDTPPPQPPISPSSEVSVGHVVGVAFVLLVIVACCVYVASRCKKPDDDDDVDTVTPSPKPAPQNTAHTTGTNAYIDFMETKYMFQSNSKYTNINLFYHAWLYPEFESAPEKNYHVKYVEIVPLFGVFAATGNVRVFRTNTNVDHTSHPNNQILPLDGPLRLQEQFAHNYAWSSNVSRIAVEKKDDNAGFVVSVCKKTTHEGKHGAVAAGVVSLVFFDNSWNDEDAAEVGPRLQNLIRAKLSGFPFENLMTHLSQKLSVVKNKTPQLQPATYGAMKNGTFEYTDLQFYRVILLYSINTSEEQTDGISIMSFLKEYPPLQKHVFTSGNDLHYVFEVMVVQTNTYSPKNT